MAPYPTGPNTYTVDPKQGTMFYSQVVNETTTVPYYYATWCTSSEPPVAEESKEERRLRLIRKMIAAWPWRFRALRPNFPEHSVARLRHRLWAEDRARTALATGEWSGCLR